MKHVVILGNGISGITAARHIRKLSDYQITVISAETDHFFSRTALMYIYMGHMKYENTKPYEDWFWAKNKINLVRKYVEKIDTSNKQLAFSDGGSLNYDVLILGVGSKPNKFGWPGQDLKGVQGLYSYQDLESMELYTKNIDHAVIVGGGLIGIEMAEMLHTRKIPVTFLVRESSFWNNILPPGESDLINRHIRENHIDLRLSTELKEIHGDGNGRAQAITTNTGEEIACQFVGLTAGVRPNIGFLEGGSIATNRGILVDEYLQTNIEDVFAVGDCVELQHPLPHRRAIEQVWYTGRMMGETVAQSICGEKTAYKPGIWFNSAKFFDIEYQTYGTVLPEPQAGEESFYWEYEEGNKCLTIRYLKEDMTVTGFNLFGIRYRHEVCDRWLQEGRTLQYVIEHLPEANFDPEFFTRHEPEIQEAFNEQFPENRVAIKKKSFLAKIFG